MALFKDCNTQLNYYLLAKWATRTILSLSTERFLQRPRLFNFEGFLIAYSRECWQAMDAKLLTSRTDWAKSRFPHSYPESWEPPRSLACGAAWPVRALLFDLDFDPPSCDKERFLFSAVVPSWHCTFESPRQAAIDTSSRYGGQWCPPRTRSSHWWWQWWFWNLVSGQWAPK